MIWYTSLFKGAHKIFGDPPIAVITSVCTWNSLSYACTITFTEHAKYNKTVCIFHCIYCILIAPKNCQWCHYNLPTKNLICHSTECLSLMGPAEGWSQVIIDNLSRLKQYRVRLSGLIQADWGLSVGFNKCQEFHSMFPYIIFRITGHLMNVL